MRTMRTMKSVKSVRSVRIKIAVVLVACFILFGGFAVSRNVAQAESIREKIYTSVRIQDGDSLWSIAEEYCDSDARSAISVYVDELVRINAIGNRNLLKAGSYLTVYYYR